MTASQSLKFKLSQFIAIPFVKTSFPHPSLLAFQIIQGFMKSLSMKSFNIPMTIQRFFIENHPPHQCFSAHPNPRKEENKYEKISLSGHSC